ncbi:MAG: LON peptidase substrate-binding domain-containing protein [Pyrinomonadaceae bacterium]
MSEAAEKVKGIRHLPLFPLPMVVLPNEVLPLHIFEPRYRQMLKDVRSDRGVFGVTFLDESAGSADRPSIDRVGCAVELREVQMLPDGRANIVTSGVMRYRTLEYVETGDPYLVGDVRFFDDEVEAEATLEPLADEVHGLFERVAKAAFKLSGNRGTFDELPKTSPLELSFLVAAAFNLDNDLKYKMLEMTSTSTRLESLREILVQAVGKIEESAEMQTLARSNGHSDKKMDI